MQDTLSAGSTLGRELERLRTAADLTLEQLAKRVHCYPGYLAGIERGIIDIPGELLRKLTNEFGASAATYEALKRLEAAGLSKEEREALEQLTPTEKQGRYLVRLSEDGPVRVIGSGRVFKQLETLSTDQDFTRRGSLKRLDDTDWFDIKAGTRRILTSEYTVSGNLAAGLLFVLAIVPGGLMLAGRSPVASWLAGVPLGALAWLMHIYGYGAWSPFSLLAALVLFYQFGFSLQLAALVGAVAGLPAWLAADLIGRTGGTIGLLLGNVVARRRWRKLERAV